MAGDDRRPLHYDRLDLTNAEAWALLGRGAADRRAAFHTPALATIGLDGRPRVRTVVLRRIDATHRLVDVHTDRRSAKRHELVADPRASLLFYDVGWKVQVRVEGRASLHADDEIADAAWARGQVMSRVCYAQVASPGTVVDDPAAATVNDLRGDVAGREAFAVIRLRVETLEWLYLAHDGHRRALFLYAVDGTLRHSTWLAP